MTTHSWIRRGIITISLLSLAGCADQLASPLARSRTGSSVAASLTPGVFHGPSGTFVVDTVSDVLRGGGAPRTLSHASAVRYFKLFTHLDRYGAYVEMVKKNSKIAAAKQRYDQGMRPRTRVRAHRASAASGAAPTSVMAQPVSSRGQGGTDVSALHLGGPARMTMAAMDDCTDIELAIYAKTGEYAAAQAALDEVMQGVGADPRPDEENNVAIEYALAEVARLELELNILVVQWNTLGCDQTDPVPDYDSTWLGNTDPVTYDDGGGGSVTCYTEVWEVDKSFDGGNTWYFDSYFYIDRCT